MEKLQDFLGVGQLCGADFTAATGVGAGQGSNENFCRY